MKVHTRYRLLVVGAAVVYFVASKFLFDKVFDTSHIVIDELFHIPQGLAYCHENFEYWDPKITTLPGLYVLSYAALSNYFGCNTYNLRMVNLVASVLNIFLLSSIIKYTYPGDRPLKTVVQAVSIALLPPLYFYSHVYYTDTLSLTFMLAYTRLILTNKYRFITLLVGLYSVFMRQTNIVWIAMVFGHRMLNIIIRSSRVYGNEYFRDKIVRRPCTTGDLDHTKVERYYTLIDLIIALRYHFATRLRNFFKFLSLDDCLIIVIHLIMFSTFCAFIFVNGSIVLGDKKAHEASIHIPQLFYFLLFYGFFGLPHVLNKIPDTLKLILTNKRKVLYLLLIFLAVAHYNTIIHPYLLADNRHYTFYVWNRWFGKYEFAKYITVPVYIFLLFNLYANLKDQNCIAFLLPLTVAMFLVLCLQRMIEVRYFLIPYIIIRLRFGRPSLKLVFAEFLWYAAVNVAAFHIFFTKEFMWKDFDYPQRIIW